MTGLCGIVIDIVLLVPAGYHRSVFNPFIVELKQLINKA